MHINCLKGKVIIHTEFCCQASPKPIKVYSQKSVLHSFPHLKVSVVFIVLDHIHESASQCFQEVGRVHLCLELQLGAQTGGEQHREVEKREAREAGTTGGAENINQCSK